MQFTACLWALRLGLGLRGVLAFEVGVQGLGVAAAVRAGPGRIGREMLRLPIELQAVVAALSSRTGSEEFEKAAGSARTTWRGA